MEEINVFGCVIFYLFSDWFVFEVVGGVWNDNLIWWVVLMILLSVLNFEVFIMRCWVISGFILEINCEMIKVG